MSNYRFKTEKEFLEEYGSSWRTQLEYAVFVQKMDYLLGEDFPYDIKEVPGPFELIPEDFSRESTIDGYYIWNITRPMLTINIPSYKPKKTIRTLEAYNSKEEAKEITIRIRNLDEYELIYDVLKENGYKVFDGFRRVVLETKEPINIFINLKTGEITQTILSLRNGTWTNSPIYDGVWEREFTIDDLPYIKRIIEAGRIIAERPSYEPKKIIKKLDESFKLDYLPAIPPILTPYQQKQHYKIGDVVYIRPDAFDYFYDINSSMDQWLGKYAEITYVNIAEDIYDTYAINGKDMKPDDLLVTLQNSDSETCYWFYRCLVNIEFAIPSYKPRKVDRVIEESFRNDYDISPEKYQEKFGKISPSLIPIEEIEEFYDVKFEDYCNDLYPQLNESPDEAVYIMKTSWMRDEKRFNLYWKDPGAYAFGYYKGIMYISPEGKGHGSMGPTEERKTKMFDRNDFEYPGRLWTEAWLISFWKYPPKEEMRKVLNDISNASHIKIHSGWKIEIIERRGFSEVSKNVPIDEYIGSEKRSDKELAIQHIVSPLLKPKKEVPYGYGSKNPSYQSKRAWDIASLTTESNWHLDFKERKKQLSKGKYSCIIIDITHDEQEELYQYLKKLEVIGDIGRARDNNNFVFLTKKYSGLESFQLFSYSNISEIRSHMNHHFYIEMDEISPIMTLDLFKRYMDRTLVRSASDMYAPKKIDRTLEKIEILNESFDKNIGFVIYCETRQQYERIQKDLIEWGYTDNDVDTIDEEELDNSLLYPIMIMINPEQYDVFFTYCDSPFNDYEDDDALPHFNQYESPNNFYEDREAVQFIKNKGVIIPNYTPRKIDRFNL